MRNEIIVVVDDSKQSGRKAFAEVGGKRIDDISSVTFEINGQRIDLGVSSIYPGVLTVSVDGSLVVLPVSTNVIRLNVGI